MLCIMCIFHSLGRRVSIIVISSLLIVASFASSFIYNIPSLLVLRFLTGVGSVQAYTASYVLALEFLTPVHRNRFNVVLNIMWVLGGFLLTGLAYFVRDFQHLCYAIGGPVVVLVILTWLAPESPRWYLVKGRHEECRKVLERVARINKAPFPQELFQKMIKKNTVPQQKEQLTKQAEGDELVKRGISDGELVAGDACEETTVTVRAGRKENYLTLYKHKDTGIRMLIFVLNWTVNALVYYALVFNVSNMGGSIYVNFAFTNGADLLGLIVVFVVVDRLGRKASYEAFLLLSAVACLATVIPFYFAEPGMTSTIVNILSLIGRFGVSSSFNILFMFSSEFVPTPLRTTSLGIFSLSSRLGSVSGPFIADVGVLLGGRMKEVLPLLVCGIAGLIAFLSALILPETNKQSLPNTIADTKNLIKSQKKKGTPSLGSFVRVTDLDVPVFIPDRGTSEEESRLKLSGI
ncbi:organic cation transporter protein [Aplysia californica]|uniref:Organic cation transporter protein n=1 Tax=Aplysia californica TaxID=6500 RepID=A0ABM1A1B7_APLCA|nr:organic cation transporter protein [Aplysia californica]